MKANKELFTNKDPTLAVNGDSEDEEGLLSFMKPKVKALVITSDNGKSQFFPIAYDKTVLDGMKQYDNIRLIKKDENTIKLGVHKHEKG